MIYGSVCSGIEAATVAWEPLGWKPAFFSEIEPFPRAVLAHHYPDIPCHGDFTTIEPGQYATIDLLVGGTPCQDFSVAGLRAGLTGDRGRLTVEYCSLAKRLRPRWLVWENVPGVLSADDGNAFGIFLGALAELGYGTAYRVFDAQYFGVPQRRRRVFVVGHRGDWRASAAVLFDSESLQGNPAPRKGEGEVSPTLPSRTTGGGGFGTDFELDGGLVAFSNTAGATALSVSRTTAPPLTNRHGDPGCVAFSAGNSSNAYGIAISREVSPPLRAANSGTNQVPSMAQGDIVRHFTPIECERLQGFPDNYTLVPYRRKLAADTPRYKALGNSMAVPVMRWIGERIVMVEQLMGVAA